jgi:N-methylhydantoinase A/oxoprolinase/acetone carboxylase beta subunit
LIHKYCGILSAYGLGLADVVKELEEPMVNELTEDYIHGKYISQIRMQIA